MSSIIEFRIAGREVRVVINTEREVSPALIALSAAEEAREGEITTQSIFRCDSIVTIEVEDRVVFAMAQGNTEVPEYDGKVILTLVDNENGMTLSDVAI